MTTTIAIVVGAGAGHRFANGAIAKQYTDLDDKCVFYHALRKFIDNRAITKVIAVIAENDKKIFTDKVGRYIKNKLSIVYGGNSRQQSVYNALTSLERHNPDLVLVHDAARPLLTNQLINNLIDEYTRNNQSNDDIAVIPALKLTDTVKTSSNGISVSVSVDRNTLYAAQTPQCFSYNRLLQAHRWALTVDNQFSDDASIYEAMSLPVIMIAGESKNNKITYNDDLDLARIQLNRKIQPDLNHNNNQDDNMMPDYEPRVGNGFDIHKLAAGDGIWLCGIKIADNKSLVGHSDADVGLHAITDAILGAVASGDIGDHFPPDDPKWRNASSDQFLIHALQLAHNKQARLVNIDVTIICEEPKIAPHRQNMRQQISEICKLEIDRISVKATTSEQLGAIGNRQGIAAIASATLMVKAKK